MSERTYQGRRTERHLKAVFTLQEENARNLAGDKELVQAWSVLVQHSRNVVEPIKVRWYMARSKGATTIHCSVWLHSPGVTHRPAVHASGYGSASGYGYDKFSEAFASALSSAGVELYGSPYRRNQGEVIDYRKRAYIGGVGEDAMREACTALIEAMGYRGRIHFATH